MKKLKRSVVLQCSICILANLLLTTSAVCQSKSESAMKNLSFVVGDWVGVSTTYKNDSILKQVPAFQKISFGLDTNIITIDLMSETLQLHTVIYFDNTDDTYYYTSFSKKGSGKSSAEYIDGKLIVSPNESRRYIFQLTNQGELKEHGEVLKNGRWLKYFEDIFTLESDN